MINRPPRRLDNKDVRLTHVLKHTYKGVVIAVLKNIHTAEITSNLCANPLSQHWMRPTPKNHQLIT